MQRSPFDTLRSKLDKRRGAQAPHYRYAPADMPSADLRPIPKSARQSKPPRKPTALERLVNQWWNRLLASIFSGSFSEQEAEYESGSTTRDYLWNTVGTSVWGFSFPALTIVATQLAGAEGAGKFSLAFVVGTLLMILANYGVRTFQVSDIEEHHSFMSYQINRWITAAVALVAGILYCTLREYDSSMATICLGVFSYKIIDGVADVYEGRLQQADKLYLAGISQTVRSVGAIAGFSVALLLTRSLEFASLAMAIVAGASLVLLTAPLALLETEKSPAASIGEVGDLVSSCFPLFAALFFFNLIESMPKFAMEGTLAYENQLYFNALYFPAQGILLAIGFVYKPQLLRLASIWTNPRKRRRFDLIIIAVMFVVVLFTLIAGVFMGWIGIPLMSFMYGLDFEPMRPLAYLMVAAGGITAAIDFLYAIITVLRRAHEVMKLYAIAFAASVVVPALLVRLFGLTGAVLSYLMVMALLLGLLIWQYAHIRRAITRERDPFAE